MANARVTDLNTRPVQPGRYVLYWMQAAQRAECNPALEHAIAEANRLDQPLRVVFGLTPHFPEANERHYRFMLEGLRETAAALAKRDIPLAIERRQPPAAALALAGEASLLVCDRGYLRLQKQWREQVARNAPCRVVQVETEVVVPVDEVSGKEEAGAYTLRPKLTKLLGEYLRPVARERLRRRWEGGEANGGPDSIRPLHGDDLDTDGLDGVAALPRYGSGSRFTGGTSQALKLLRRFLREGLAAYPEQSREPGPDATSHLSPYLHFGQISPLQVAPMAQEVGGDGAARFLEQLLVRRELAMNFVHHNPRYDSFDCLVGWQAQTLGEHAHDRRPYVCTLEQLEAADTHDEYWNAAMREMLLTGFMHGYMRMYWGKQIIAWSPDPREAFGRILCLNNKYFLDGRDPVSFANVAWCFGKHDRPFMERPIFGKVRTMNAAGLRRKFDMAAYLRRVEDLGG
ncbi:deoxyribodipyrimidine photo-lyase [bacterium]|nr:deoxyribodipyrimidine photo-lyase [bacterium]